MGGTADDGTDGGARAGPAGRGGATPADARARLPFPRLAMGSAPLGNLFRTVEHEAAVATVRTAVGLGVRLVDTAPLYGHGLAEARVGAALAGLDREDVLVSTKVGRLLRPDGEADPVFRDVPPVAPVRDYSAEGVRRSLEESLERLGLDRVDIALVHDPDDHLDEAEAGAFPELLRMRDEGIIGAVGAGMNQCAALVRFVDRLDLDVVLVAGRYTLLDTEADEVLLPRCAERGVAVLAGGVFNSGILATPDADPTYDYAPADEALVARARRLREVLAPFGVSLMAAALRFTVAHPTVTTLLLGPRSVEELEELLALVRDPVPDEAWDALEAARLIPAGAPRSDEVLLP